MVIIGIAVLTPRLLRRLAFFRVRNVEVVGNRYLAATAVVRGLHLRDHASIFDATAPILAAAAAMHGIVAVTVERRLPGTLRLGIREATPVALAPVNDRLVLVDSRGHVLPFDPIQFPASLPICGHDAATAGVLGRVMQFDRALYDVVESARLDRGDVVLDFGGHHIRLSPGAGADALRAAEAVHGYLDQHNIAWREIDARLASRVFVQKADS